MRERSSRLLSGYSIEVVSIFHWEELLQKKLNLE